MPRTKPSIYQLKVTLKGTKPPIWRRFQVKSNVRLSELHSIIQTVMGWYDSHLHEFTIDGRSYGMPDPDWDDMDVVDDHRAVLNRVVQREKSKFTYQYDFGDDWRHELLLEQILDPEPGVTYPVCLAGKRACPPEDVGGVWGYAQFLETTSDPQDPEHDEMLEWAGDDFDPEAFDRDAVNRMLAVVREPA